MSKALITKKFIQMFNFPHPNWNDLPDGFPEISNKGLTKQEKHLLDAIKLAWMTSEGKRYLVSKVVKKTVVAAVVIFVLYAGGSLVGRNQSGTKGEVSAKTVGKAVGNIVEATMSAVFRR